MTTTIAIAGKGGVGKTIIAALLIDLLSQKGIVLAVDADPSANLNLALGLPLEGPVGGVREEMVKDIQKQSLPTGVPMQDILQGRIRATLVESDKVDLLTMGRPEGPGCYCAANHMLRLSIGRLTRNYDYVVIDCEAGMEHISRQTAGDIDVLLTISDPTVRGITAAAAMKELIQELRTKVGGVYLVINRVKGGPPWEIKEAADGLGLHLIATILEDPNLADLEVKGTPLIQLPPDSPLQLGVREITDKLKL